MYAKRFISALLIVTMLLSINCFMFAKAEEGETITITGVVTDKAANALEGVTVTVNQNTTQTDAEGNYLLEIEVAENYDISAQKEGYSPFNQIIPHTDVESITKSITLNDLVTISGTLTDAASNLLEGVWITVSNDSINESIITDEEGFYSVVIEAGEEYEITAKKDDFTYYSETIEHTQNPITYDITLENYYLITGAILYNSNPAVLTKLNGEDRVFEAEITSPQISLNANENSEFNFIGTGECEIIIKRQGQFMGKSVTIPDCAIVDEPVNIDLDTAKVELSVKDENDLPITRIETQIEKAPYGLETNYLYSQTGEYVIAGFEASLDVERLTVKAKGYSSYTQVVDFSGITSGEALPMNFVLKKGSIKLNVRNSSGDLVDCKTVKIDDSNVSVERQSKGIYQITNIDVSQDDTRQIFIVGADNYNSQVIKTKVVNDSELEITAYLLAKTETVYGSINGTIVDKDSSEGIEGAIVRVADKFAISGLKGKYTIYDIPIGKEYSISVEKEGYLDNLNVDYIAFDEKDTTHSVPNIQLEKAKTVTGTVKDKLTGLPVGNAKISLSDGHTEYSANNGSFIMDNVTKGMHSISVNANGYALKLIQNIDLTGSVEVVNLDIELDLISEPGLYSIVGAIHNTKGEPVSGALVSEMESDYKTYTDKNGKFTITQIVTKPDKISISKSGYDTKTFQLKGQENTTLSQSFVISNKSHDAKISGKVTDISSKSAVDGALVYAYITDDNGLEVILSSALTDENGSYELQGLAPDTIYNICALKEGFELYEKSAYSDTSDCDFNITGGGSITITVKGKQGDFLQDVLCYNPKTGKAYKTDENGIAEIKGLSLGSCEIIIKADPKLYNTVVYSTSLSQSVPNKNYSTTLTAPSSDTYIEGRVLDKNTNLPIIGAYINADGKKTFTDHNGFYKIYGLERFKEIEISASMEGYTSSSEVIRTAADYEENVLDLYIQANRGIIYGKVVDQDGNAIENADVKSLGNFIKTDKNGFFMIKDLPLRSSAIAVTVSKNGYAEDVYYGYLSKSSTASEVNITIIKTARLTVIARQRGTGRSINAGKVYLQKSGDSSADQLVYNLNSVGECFINDLPSGKYLVWVSATGYKTSTKTNVEMTGTNIELPIYLDKKSESNNPGGGNPSSGPYVPQPTPTPLPTPTPEEEWQGFADLSDPSLSWALEPIDGLVENGIVAKDVNFRPNDNVKREEYVKMLVMAFGLHDENANCDFADVSEDDWYYSYVASAYQAGIVQGLEDNTFGAGLDITRQDLCVMTYRVAQIVGTQFEKVTEPETFTDSDSIADYSLEAITQMQSAGIINGMGNGTFAPRSNATRAQSAKILWGLIQ